MGLVVNSNTAKHDTTTSGRVNVMRAMLKLGSSLSLFQHYSFSFVRNNNTN
jgi:hypothetical protein